MKNLNDNQINMIDSAIRLEEDYDATLTALGVTESHPNYGKMYDTLSQAVSDISNVTSDDAEDDCDDQVSDVIYWATSKINDLVVNE